jgi:hypothetical protein
MSWTDLFPVFTDDMVEDFEKLATEAEKLELETFHGVDKVFNAQDKPHIVSVSLFWKHVRESDPDLPEPTRELMMNAKQLGLVRRFSPWETYVEPLLHHVPTLREQYPDVAFRVYLARDLEFLIVDLLQAGCEVFWMKSSSIRLVPGSLWRLLPFEESGKLITMLDSDLMKEAPKFIAKTQAMEEANLGAWRIPLAKDFGPDGRVPYLPFLGCNAGMRGGWPVRQLLDAFTWHCRAGRMSTSVNLPTGGTSTIEQSRWPDYGFEEWFLLAVMYPRVAHEGILTFLLPTDQSVFLSQDIEYVTWANSNSEIVYFTY